jgi:DNA-binding GntR family transcriptional regulator
MYPLTFRTATQTKMKAGKTSRGKSKAASLVDQVYHDMQNRILNNVWETGHRALEQELAEELGVSRTPIREALAHLQRDGLVKIIPRHGMMVLPISLKDIQEIHQILTSLEGLAVELKKWTLHTKAQTSRRGPRQTRFSTARSSNSRETGY